MGTSMTLAYAGVSIPFEMGTRSGNLPESGASDGTPPCGTLVRECSGPPPAAIRTGVRRVFLCGTTTCVLPAATCVWL